MMLAETGLEAFALIAAIGSILTLLGTLMLLRLARRYDTPPPQSCADETEAE